MKTILAKIDGSENDAAVLESSYLVANLFESHITCLYVRPDSLQLIMNAADGIGLAAGALPISPQVREELLEADKARAESVRRGFEAYCARRQLRLADAASAVGGVSVSWREVVGDPTEVTTSTGRFYDLVVLARSQMGGDLYLDNIGSILVACGRPLLLVASAPPQTIGSTIAVAWKETPEAARAVTAATPLLAQAQKIVVLCSQEAHLDAPASKQSGQMLVDQLRWRGLQAHAQTVAVAGQTPAQAILAAATEAGANLLVMGAYGHSRARELVFGGVTRHVLKGAPIPVLLCH